MFASQRDRIYDLYEIYRKRKQELGGYDAAERYVISMASRHPINHSKLTRTQALISAMNGRSVGKGIDCL